MTPKAPRTTIRDVALAAGVGLQTVSRVLNGGHYVKPTTSARIQATIKKLGYQPNEAARVLAGRRSRTIGLIIPDLTDPFFSSCAHAIQQAAMVQGYMTFVLTSEHKPGLERKEIEMMAQRNIAGLLIIPTAASSAGALAELVSDGIPVVTLDRMLKSPLSGEVIADNRCNAKEAVDHLISHGHRRIMAIGYNLATSTCVERIAGYKSAMADARLKPEICECHGSDVVGPELLKRLNKKAPPSALFCLSDVVTFRALQALNSRSISIPSEMALIGFDDFELAPLLKVPVTAVRQPSEEMGRQAANLLFRHIHSGGVRTASVRIVLPMKIIIRRSCGCNSG